MWLACQKKSYLICDEITNFRIFTKPIPYFFEVQNWECQTGPRQLLKKILHNISEICYFVRYQNDRMNLSFVKDLHVIGKERNDQKLSLNGHLSFANFGKHHLCTYQFEVYSDLEALISIMREPEIDCIESCCQNRKHEAGHFKVIV